MKTISMAIADLKFDENNARKHNKKNIAAICGSLAKFGQQKPIVVNQDMVVIAGNGTLEAAKKLGWDKVDAVVTTLKGTAAKAFALADNRTAELATWDNDILAGSLAELVEDDWDIQNIGFGFSEMERTSREGLTDDDDVPEVRTNILGVAPGDVWKLGEHRLVCGDVEETESWELLMGTEKAQVCWTDPPYNVDYVGKTKDKLKIQNDKMTQKEFRRFLTTAMTGITQALVDGGAFYVAHADSEGYNFRGAVQDAGLALKQCLIGTKNTMVMGRQDYHWQHEPILYGWKPGGAHSWYADRKQTTVLEFDRPSRSKDHPTMKPVKLVEYCLLNSSRKYDAVLDPFGGSGSTLIAAEKIDRKCFMMELDPHYCSVIIKRWEEFSGKEAECLQGVSRKAAPAAPVVRKSRASSKSSAKSSATQSTSA